MSLNNENKNNEQDVVMVRVLKIDAERQEVLRTWIRENVLSDIYTSIGNSCEVFEIFPTPDFNASIYIDEEGRLKDPVDGFLWKGSPLGPIIGNGLIVEHDAEGNMINTTKNPDEILNRIDFIPLKRPQATQEERSHEITIKIPETYFNALREQTEGSGGTDQENVVRYVEQMVNRYIYQYYIKH